MAHVSFPDLDNADLIVDAIYEGGPWKDIRSEPISKVLECANGGCFRPVVNSTDRRVKYMVLTSSLTNVDWPDRIDNETGVFTYFGDNKKSGKDRHHPKGNQFLKEIFNWLHTDDKEKVRQYLCLPKHLADTTSSSGGLPFLG